MSTAKAKKIVKQYADYLKLKKFPFSNIFLYGSQAKGKAHKWSDIDVCVVSKKFQGKYWEKYEKDLWNYRYDVDIRISPIGLSPDELTDISPLGYEIKKNGIKII